VKSLLKCQKLKEEIDETDDSLDVIVDYMTSLLKRALSNRVLVIKHLPEWTSDEGSPNLKNIKWLTFGLLIDCNTAYNNIERGPSGDSPEAKSFREFWGKRSELRRFHDNSICEAVYWKTKSFADKRQIIDKSLEFVFTNTLGIPKKSFFITTTLLDPILERPHLRFTDKSVYGTGEEFNLLISKQFDALAKKLRAIEELPLSITAVLGIDAVLRGTEVSNRLESLQNMNILPIL
jgi:U3 small nucleolar RNA-associated protein 22